MKTALTQLVHKSTTAITTVRGAVLTAAVVGIGFMGVTAFAYGPDRPTFTGENPADYVTFNSITNNPNHGDERNFVLIREAGKGTYSDSIKVQPGKEYEVYSYFHNNAKSTLNASGAGIAENVRMSAQVPSVVKANETGSLSTSITADNAKPKKVWDEAFVTTDNTVALSYVAASATVHSNGAVNNQGLAADALFSTQGAYLGFDSLNGILPGCNEYAGYVVYRVKVDQPNFVFKKEVSTAGQNKWVSSLQAKIGDKVDYKLTYTNTGTTRQNDITVKDALPAGLNYVAGSTKVANLNAPNGVGVSDSLTTKGINAGSYGPDTSATITYSATIAKDAALTCGQATLVNKASAITANGTKSDQASVAVTVDCQPGECKPGVPTGDQRCESEKCSLVGHENEPKDSAACATTVTELPRTGTEQIVGTIIGLILLAMGTTYYLKSRADLKRTLALGAAGSDTKLLPAHTDTHPEDDKTTI